MALLTADAACVVPCHLQGDADTGAVAATAAGSRGAATVAIYTLEPLDTGWTISAAAEVVCRYITNRGSTSVRGNAIAAIAVLAICTAEIHSGWRHTPLSVAAAFAGYAIANTVAVVASLAF